MKGFRNGLRGLKRSRRKLTGLVLAFCVLAGIASPAAPSLTAEAATKKTVYVVTKAWHEGVNAWGEEYKDEIHKYAYNANGFVTKITKPEPSHTLTYKYTYKGKNISAVKYSSKEGKFNDSWVNYDYSGKPKLAYDKKGRLYRFEWNYYHVRGDTHSLTCYYDSKGRIHKVLRHSWNADEPEEKQAGYKMEWKYNSKGQVSKFRDGYSSWDSWTKLKYDKKGYVNKRGKLKGKNVYKSGLLVSSAQKDGDYKLVYKFKYKKIRVPAKYASAMKKQQKYLVNDMLMENGSGGIMVYPGMFQDLY